MKKNMEWEETMNKEKIILYIVGVLGIAILLNFLLHMDILSLAVGMAAGYLIRALVSSNNEDNE